MANLVPPIPTANGNYWVDIADAIEYFRYGAAHPDRMLPGVPGADLICAAILGALQRQNCGSCHIGAEVIFGERSPNDIGVYGVHEPACPGFAGGTLIKRRTMIGRREEKNGNN